MRRLKELIVTVLTGWFPKHWNDRSIVGRSKLDEQSDRIEIVFLGVVVLLWIAFQVLKEM